MMRSAGNGRAPAHPSAAGANPALFSADSFLPQNPPPSEPLSLRIAGPALAKIVFPLLLFGFVRVLHFLRELRHCCRPRFPRRTSARSLAGHGFHATQTGISIPRLQVAAGAPHPKVAGNGGTASVPRLKMSATNT
jgi:hypothetical protein